MPEPVHIAVIAGTTAPVLSMVSPVLKERKIKIVALRIETDTQMLDIGYYHLLLKKAVETVWEQSKRSDTLSLSFWHYEFREAATVKCEIRKLFFPFSCQVQIPVDCFKRDILTRDFITDTLPLVKEWINTIAVHVIEKRNSSPFLLPLQNFQSDTLIAFSWDLLRTLHTKEPNEIPSWLRSRRQQLRQAHWKISKRSGQGCFHNRKGHAFQPSPLTELHGVAWPDRFQCFLPGWFRFGASLLQGFHYDVQRGEGKAWGKFFGCDGTREYLAGGRYAYVNVYPNDHFEPKEGP